MTALLAFFIVLNSLANEQTGLNLYSGTGSFIRATDTLGVPGIFREGRSRHPVQLDESSPLYLVEDEQPLDRHGDGPDPENDSLFLRDREQEDFERLLNELERLHTPIGEEVTLGEVSFDRHHALPVQPPHLDQSLQVLLAELRPDLVRGHTQLELIVWTPTPAEAAWQRSASMASVIAQEAAAFLQLDEQSRTRLMGSSRTWGSSTRKRPVLTVVVRKTTLQH